MEIERNASKVIERCNELMKYWTARNGKFPDWYRLIEQEDELKTAKMESFVGNEARSMFNLVLHMLDAKVPHKLEGIDTTNQELSQAAYEISNFLETMWEDAQRQFRLSGPRQSLKRTLIGYLLSTGWYAAAAFNTDDGERSYIEPICPADVYPMWDMECGLSEVAYVYKVGARVAKATAKRFGIEKRFIGESTIYNYWWLEPSISLLYRHDAWHAMVIDNELVKFGLTRFHKIPVYVAPVGGLPDVGTLSALQPTNATSSSYSAGSQVVNSERWKAEIGQSIVATNENIYRTWNKWWTFSLQLLRDTAQPRIFERSRSGKAIVKPEEVFKRGAIWRGGPDDSVEFVQTPTIPMELRTSQLDLEAMMQRGGVSWSMYGSPNTYNITSYVMSQIASSASQVIKPFLQALIDLYSDIDNDCLEDVKERGIHPYGFTLPSGLPANARVSAEYEVEIPGDLVQRATTARMLNPDFKLSYSYVIEKLFPDIRNSMKERARLRADEAELRLENSLIAYILYCRKQASDLIIAGDNETAELYRLAGEATLAQLKGQQTQQLRQPTQAQEIPTEGALL